MEKKIILRGALAGAIAGLLAFVFARIFAEPQIQAAIDYESGRHDVQALLDKAASLPTEPPGPDIFSRTIQANVGIGTGMIVFGVAMGLLFAVVYTVCLGRVGTVRARTLALLVAGGGFLGIHLVPFVKYPANPPSIGTIVYPGFPADTLFLFRFYSVGAQLVLWTTLALVFGPLAQRVLNPKPATAAAAVPVT